MSAERSDRLASTRLRIQSATAKITKRLGYHTPAQRLLFHQYDYMFTPGQLAFLCEQVLATEDVDGPVVEIGCAGGSTTVFLNKYLDELESKRDYICIDTFDGFTDADIAVERGRGKTAHYEFVFKAYSKKYFERALRNNGVSRPRVHQADVNEFDFSAVRAPSLVLLDVDLYRPVKHTLDELRTRMAPGGVIVVDDCAEGEYDGAYQAYREHVAEHALDSDIRLGKLGVVTFPTSTAPP